MDDPFFTVKEEVSRTLQQARDLHARWFALVQMPGHSQEQLDWTLSGLKNSLRSVDWDLEDLQETISIVEQNPRKFKIDDIELRRRRQFIDDTKLSVKEMRDSISSGGQKTVSPSNTVSQSNRRRTDGYTPLEQGSPAEPSPEPYNDSYAQQQLMLDQQDETIEHIGGSVNTLKSMSRQIGNELDEQDGMLDNMNGLMDRTEGRLDQSMKKMAKVLHMSSDRRQWCAIGVLVVILIVVILMFFYL